MFFRAFIFILALGFSSNVFFYHSAWALDALPDNISSFTHTLELKPIPHNYQMAKATFLPDRYDDLGLSDYDSIKSIQPDRNCESYTLSSCPAGGLCERCPFDVRKFRAYACKAPYLMSNGDCVCPAETPLIYPNDKCTQYCGSRCIQKTCTPSANKTNCTNSTQNCDNGCGQNTRKCCVPCTHKITSKPANSSYTYSSCTDDDGAKQIQTGWKCDPGYHERNGGCEKDCIANSCSGYTLATCPTNATCSSCTKETTGCDGGDTVFKKTGCASGYKDCNGSCISSSECCGGCASGQKCENGSCVSAYVSRACQYVGDILYQDKTCAGVNDTLDPSKTVIGVVFDMDRRLAIALDEVSWTWASKAIYDISGLTNYTSELSATGDYNGKNNTSIIRAHGDSNGYETPAADYCYNYTTIGTNQGDWYLPAAGELYLIYQNKDILNNSLSKVNGKTFYLANWSSTEYNGGNAWLLSFGNGKWSNRVYKSTYDRIRPVLAF